MSPAAYTRGLDVCSRSFTSTPRLGSYAIPADSRFRPSTLGARPMPTRISSTRTPLVFPSCSTWTTFSIPSFETRTTFAFRISSTPSATKDFWTIPAASGSSRGFGQGEDRLVGEVPGSPDPRDRGSRSPGARADGSPLEPEAHAVHFDGVGSGKSPLAQKDVDAQLFGKPVDGVVEADVRPDAPHPLHRFPEIDCQVPGSPHTEFPGGARIVDCPGGPDDPLGGDAPDVQAVPAHEFAFDEGDFCAQPGGSRGGDEPGRPRSDDHQVVAVGGDRVFPG